MEKTEKLEEAPNIEKVEDGDYSKSVEELIDELRKIDHTFSNLDTGEMTERTRGFVQGVIVGLKHAINPPNPDGVEFLSVIAKAYERKYGLKPEDPAKTAEAIEQAKAVYEEIKKQPDWEARYQVGEKYRKWPQGEY